jgi:hypothetical protein
MVGGVVDMFSGGSLPSGARRAYHYRFSEISAQMQTDTRLSRCLARIHPRLAWLGEEDKVKHVTISSALVLGSAWLLPLWLTIALTMLIGLGKELLDLFYYRSGFCWYDMLANGIGCTLGVGLTLLRWVL